MYHVIVLFCKKFFTDTILFYCSKNLAAFTIFFSFFRKNVNLKKGRPLFAERKADPNTEIKKKKSASPS